MTHPTSVELHRSLGGGLNRDRHGRPNLLLEQWLDGPGHLLGRIDDLVRGEDGWSLLLDPTGAPQGWLGWLAQFAGVRLADGLSETAQRNRIVETSGQRRGTVAAIRGAARQELTGTRLVRIDERQDADGNPDPYRFHVTTFDTETPDPDAVEAALVAEKPAGLQFTYQVRTGATYDELSADFDTYGDLTVRFVDYDEMRAYVPGEG